MPKWNMMEFWWNENELQHLTIINQIESSESCIGTFQLDNYKMCSFSDRKRSSTVPTLKKIEHLLVKPIFDFQYWLS